MQGFNSSIEKSYSILDFPMYTSEAHIFGCFFHLKKSLLRHIRDDDPSKKNCNLSTDQNFVRFYSKLVACLIFIPTENVVDAFAASQLNKLYKYFEDNYIGARGRENTQIRAKISYHDGIFSKFDFKEGKYDQLDITVIKNKMYHHKNKTNR
ncbi:hypothetical protein BpHYR1_038727 [Brachionus plicatilis]|uniref:MULE transposase domain-containing protein n=1 Tax=Brachionus plicatilis TaxID=10195 RepID=A0A3M7SA54_BRAPC|nr:hypothetical protein BpHYR1_038727 [Brachionus plicatilis]